MFIIVDKLTGDILNQKIYTHQGTAQNQVKRRGFYLPKHEPVVIPMPSEHVLMRVADGANYSTVKDMGRLEPHIRDIDWDD